MLLHIALWATLPMVLLATESGTTAFPTGGEDFLVAGMPLESFDLKANVSALRLDWIKPVSLFGADRWGTLLFMPVIDLDLSLNPAPGVLLRGSKRGLGDITLGTGLSKNLKWSTAWTWSCQWVPTMTLIWSTPARTAWSAG